MTTENRDTAIVKREAALPTSFEEINFMAKAFVASGMFQDTKQLSQAIVKIQAGRELGLPPVYSMQNINMIRNRLTSSANTMAMLVKRSGRYNYRIKEHTDHVCAIVFFEKDGDKWVEVGVSSFSMDDAKRAELVKPESGWVKYPRAMLFSRAISQGARTYAPDAIGGMYTDEEIRSIPPRPNEDVTVEEPAKEPEPTPKPVESATEAAKAEVSSKPQEATAEAPAVRPGSPQADKMDRVWLAETLKIIRWTEATAKSWIKSNLKVDASGTLIDVCNSLPPDKLEQFAKKIADLRQMA